MRIVEVTGEIANMPHSSVNNIDNGEGAKLPRRDWILMPMLGLLTICLVALSVNSIASRMYSASQSTVYSCLTENDQLVAAWGIPNTICMQKDFETELSEYRFNGCGHRAGMECGPKPPGTFRIVVIGSSVAFGMSVPREKSFAGLLPAELSSRVGRRVEIYNVAMINGFPCSVALHLDEAFAAQPDMILWALTSPDIGHSSVDDSYTAPPSIAKLGISARMQYRVTRLLAASNVQQAIITAWDLHRDQWVTRLWKTPSGILLNHLLYASQRQYMKSFLMSSDGESGFLKMDPSDKWRDNLLHFDRDVAQITSRTRAAGVPLVATYLPSRGQATMISMNEWPTGYDPYELDHELRSIITSYGGIYLDVLPSFRNVHDLQADYYAVEGHPNARGHAIFATLLAERLTSGSVPALTVAAQPQVESKESR